MYKCTDNKYMAYQWDSNKAASNLRKHGIDFADAVSVFSDDLAITLNSKKAHTVPVLRSVPLMNCE